MVTLLHVVALGEARELLSVLRRNRRFGYFLSFAASSQPSEHPFVKEIKLLRDIILENSNAPGRSAGDASANGLFPEPDLRKVLEPFLHVITSRDASGVITGVALLCVDRIIASLFHIISSIGDADLWAEYAPTLSMVINSVSACRFDPTDPAADEVVLARITSAVVRIATSPAVPHLSDASMLRGIEACLGIASGRKRASELLRRTAETALCEIVSSLGRAAVHCATPDSRQAELEVVPGATGPEGAASSNDGVGTHSFNAEVFEENGPLSGAALTAVLLVACKMTEPVTASSPAETVLGLQIISSILTFGSQYLIQIPSVKEVLLRDCCRSTLRCVGSFKSPLSVISGAFTVSRLLVHVLGSEATALLCTLLGDIYPCYISGLEDVKTAGAEKAGKIKSNSIPKLNHSSSGLSLNLQSLGKTSDGGSGMKNQLDPVVREVGLESLADLLSSPGLLSSLYEAADCDLKTSNVVGPLLLALGQASHSSRPRRRSKRLRASSSGSTRMSAGGANEDSDDDDSASMSGGNPDSARFARAAAVLCAEAILTIVHTIKERLDQRDEIAMSPSSQAMAERQEKRSMKLEKNRLEEAADAFNSNEKINKAEKLVVFLRDLKYVAESTADGNIQADLERDVSACVKFLRETPGIDKTRVGAILGEPDNLSRRVLAAFTGTFDFYNQPFTDSLRLFLASFRLPGESQKIDRIVESFSKAFFSVNQAKADETPANGKDAIACPARNGVSGADTSSPSSSSQKMTIGLLRNSDAVFVLSFAVVMLNTDAHNDSVRNKMKLEDFARNLRKTNDGEDFPRWFLSEIYDSIQSVEIKMKDEVGMEAMTTGHWDEILKDMHVRERVLADRTQALNFDEDIYSLCWEAAVAAANVTLIESGDANQAQKALEGFVSVAQCAKAFRQSQPVDVVVSTLVSSTRLLDGPLLGAVFRFGTDIKAQMAAVTLADIARHCEDWMRSTGWQALMTYALRLHALCLLPKELEMRLTSSGTDLEVDGKPLADSRVLPAWWPSQGDGKQISETGSEELPKRQSKTKGFFGALFAASVGSDVSSDEESEETEVDSHANGQKTIRVSHSSPVYLRLRTTEQIEAQKLARKCIARCRLEDVFLNETEALQSDSLYCMSRAIARAARCILDATGEYPESSTEDTEGGGQDPVSPSVRANGTYHSPSKGTTEDFSPSSPPADVSAIVGVSSPALADSLSVEMEGDFRGYRNRTWTGSLRSRDERKAREFVVAFCIDALCDLTLQNSDRLHIPWPALHSILVRIISPATPPSALLERSIIALLRVAIRLLDRDELRDDVLRTLNLVVRLPADATMALSEPIASGLYNLVNCHGSEISSTTGWHAIFSIIENLARCPAAVDIGLRVLSLVLSEKSTVRALHPETFSPLLDAIMAFVTQSSISSSLEAVDQLCSLSQRIPKMISNIKDSENGKENGEDGTYWIEFWGPLLKGFSNAARNSRGKVRNHALVALEKVIALLGASDFLTASQWKVALSTVILPLMKQLFSTHGFFEASVEAERAAQRKLRLVRSNSAGGRARNRSDFVSAEHDEQLVRSVLAACGKTRLRAVMLTSKTFLQHHAVIAVGLPAEEFTDLWLGVLDVFRLALHGDADDSSEIVAYVRGSEVDELQEHVPECVKNLLLVMCDCGLLSAEDSVRWNATFNLIRTFLPETAEDIEALAAVPVKENSGAKAESAPVETENCSPAEAVSTS